MSEPIHCARNDYDDDDDDDGKIEPDRERVKKN